MSNGTCKVALVAIAKDEDEYLKEWVDYHLKIGFSDIFVYQNNWRYERGDIQDGRVHFIDMDGECMQVSCYNGFIERHHQDYEFAAFLDVDEFLWMRNCTDVGEFLSGYRGVPAIFVNWRLFGDSGLSSVTDGNYSVIRRFTRCSETLDPLGKNVVNLGMTHGEVVFWNPHIVGTRECPTSVQDPTGTRWTVSGSIPGNTAEEPCEIYHFRNKTLAERIERSFQKPDPSAAGMSASHTDFGTFMREFNDANRNDVQNESLLKFVDDICTET